MQRVWLARMRVVPFCTPGAGRISLPSFSQLKAGGVEGRPGAACHPNPCLYKGHEVFAFGGGFSSFSPGGQPCEGAGGRGVPPAGDADAVAAHLLFALTSGEASRKAGVFVRSPPESHTRRPHHKPGSPAVVECVVHYQIVNRHQARHLGAIKLAIWDCR